MIVSLVIAFAAYAQIGESAVATVDAEAPRFFLDALDDPKIERPSLDKRKYHHVRLQNGVKVMLVSDPTGPIDYHVDVSISVGAVMHGREFPGLAHLLEHVIVMQPRQSKATAGLTEELNTHYYSTGSVASLRSELKLLATGIFAPIFSDEYLTRAIGEVEGEWREKCSFIPNQLQQLTYSTVYDTCHPACTFKFGNAASLLSVTIAHLQSLHEKFYSPRMATVALYSGLSLEFMSAAVEAAFGSHVREPAAFSRLDLQSPRTVRELTQSAELPRFRVPMLSPTLNTSIVYAAPISGVMSPKVEFAFWLPNDHLSASAKPFLFLREALMNTAVGGLKRELEKEGGWVRSLSAVYSRRNVGAHVLEISMSLTEQAGDFEAGSPGGVISDLAKSLFVYIQLFARGLYKVSVDPVVLMRERRFNNMEDKTLREPKHLVTALTGGLRDYPAHRAVSGPYLITDATAELVATYWNMLTPENLSVKLIGEAFRAYCVSREKWYDLPFGVDQMPDSLAEVLATVPKMPLAELAVLATTLNLDPKHVESKFENIVSEYLIPASGPPPAASALSTRSGVQVRVLPNHVSVYVDSDTERIGYNARFEFSVFSPWLLSSQYAVERFAQASVAERCVSERLESELLPAVLRGYKHKLVIEEDRMLLILEGPPDAITKMVEVYAEMFKWRDIKCRDTLQRVKQTVQGRLGSSDTSQLAYSTLYTLLKTPYYSDRELSEALTKVDFSSDFSVAPFFYALMSNANVRAGAGGNVDLATAVVWSNMLTDAVPRVRFSPDASMPQKHYVNLKSKAVFDMKFIVRQEGPLQKPQGSVLYSLQLQAAEGDSANCPMFAARNTLLLYVADRYLREFLEEQIDVFKSGVAYEPVGECNAQLQLQVVSYESAAKILSIFNQFLTVLPGFLGVCEEVSEYAEHYASLLLTKISDAETRRKSFFTELRHRVPNFDWWFAVHQNMKGLNCAELAKAAEAAVTSPKIAVVILSPGDVSLPITKTDLKTLIGWKQSKKVVKESSMFSKNRKIGGK
jgi:secreted Zn-dependent insulinase-like peptidase